MHPAEIAWRISQKTRSEIEQFRFSAFRSVSSDRFWNTGRHAHFNHKSLGINFDNIVSFHNTEIKLLGTYPYREYAFKWHAGFNTDSEWQLISSSKLRYKQRDDIGDARLNWELNRHHQLALLAKEYYISRNPEILDLFRKTFDTWNEQNPFLHGISWTSVMEVAIRAISQIYALAFIHASDVEDMKLTHELETSIINCINYIMRHYSRYSSANNHLLVEMAAIGIAGYAFDVQKWKNVAVETLSVQLPLQTYPDGVNREVSLHYHSFAMEAYLILTHVMQSAGSQLPRHWIPMLDKMASFLATSMVDDDKAIEFGDNDEGKILDLQGGDNFSHYAYILQLSSLITGKRYHSFATVAENINWLFSDSIIDNIKQQPLVNLTQSRTFADGGYSILRSNDNKTIVAIDHATHGFGSIAAHGHDDALSFQMYRDGKPIFGDPGTGVYHCNLSLRNRLRDVRHHSTIMINGKDNAEMLGAFLWGQKPVTSLYISELLNDVDTIIADSTGMSGIRHRRKFTFDKISTTLIIDDEFDSECDWVASFVLAPGIHADIKENCAVLSGGLSLSTSTGTLSAHEGEYSESYGTLNRCTILTVSGHGVSNTIVIE